MWGDFYIKLAVELRTQVNLRLHPSYFARVVSSELSFPFAQRSIGIYSTADKQLVTVIEILSPANKRMEHGAYTHYLQKRNQILNADDVHLVEIDLLRGGKGLPLNHPLPAASYYIVLSRAKTYP